jgi:hypothetical protein
MGWLVWVAWFVWGIFHLSGYTATALLFLMRNSAVSLFIFRKWLMGMPVNSVPINAS